jgi:hypothetical protein
LDDALAKWVPVATNDELLDLSKMDSVSGASMGPGDKKHKSYKSSVCAFAGISCPIVPFIDEVRLH